MSERALKTLRGQEGELRWAMLTLGELRAPEGVEALLDWVDWEYTACLLVEERYPAVAALTMIGAPAVAGAMERLAQDQTNLRRTLFCEVLRRILGKQLSLESVKIGVAGEKDEKRARRLALVVKVMESLPD